MREAATQVSRGLTELKYAIRKDFLGGMGGRDGSDILIKLGPPKEWWDRVREREAPGS